MIEPIHEVVYLHLRQRIQSRPFGHILANQPVGVFVESPLPRFLVVIRRIGLLVAQVFGVCKKRGSAASVDKDKALLGTPPTRAYVR